MRALIRTRARRDDTGAVVVLVSIMMVVLLGMGALVLDAGQLYAERRELQNGADAAALAVAQDCAGGDCKDEAATAHSYADDNAHDGKAGVDEVCGSGPGLAACATPPADVPAGNWVKVATVTPDDNKVDFVFAPVLGHDAGRARAAAVASWGAVGGATTIPLTLSECEYIELGGNLASGTFPSGLNYVYFHDTTDAGTCPAGPSGADLPGGFGWLASSSACQVTVRADRWVDDKPGNSVPNDCTPSDWQGKEVLIPVYDRVNGLTGSNGSYHLAGFAGFRMAGYRFPSDEWQNGFPCGKKPKGGTTYICGEFTRIVTTGEVGTGPDFGARVIQMIG
ncbi:MAG TPA: pilus assembly protein TadG-related protein [Acidimicrobiales bacterium]|nr:pilus assembly protein TadG-related protein [Acidimicrobiales bacterium]